MSMDRLCDQHTQMSPAASRSMLLSLVLFAFLASIGYASAAAASPSIAETCNPSEILENFWAEHFRNYDRTKKSVRIDDKGATWETTYFTPPEKRDPHYLHVGGDFPILVIDKVTCKLIEARFYQ